MNQIKLATLLSVIILKSYGQTEQDKLAILLPVQKLFDGMHLGDSAMVHNVFTKGVTLNTITEDKEGRPILRADALQGFLDAVGKPHVEQWSEMIWDPEVKRDGNLAQVWVKYAFYVGTKFSHCGIDAFHLFRSQGGDWKIFHLADTRHKEGCEVPTFISDKFK